MNTTEQLIEYGLSEREAKIYLFLIKHLEATAHFIAQGTAIPRATVYLTIESLKRHGLVSSSKKNNVTYFLAESPNRLKKIAEEKLSMADLLIPQLRSMIHSERFSPNVKQYVGKEGLKNVFEDILETLDHSKIKRLYAVSDSEVQKSLPKYFPEWVRRREKLGVITHMLAEDEGGQEIFQSNELREVRLFPSHISFDCSFDIYADKIALISIQKDQIYATVIDSPATAATFKQIFQLMWDMIGTQKRA